MNTELAIANYQFFSKQLEVLYKEQEMYFKQREELEVKISNCKQRKSRAAMNDNILAWNEANQDLQAYLQEYDRIGELKADCEQQIAHCRKQMK